MAISNSYVKWPEGISYHWIGLREHLQDTPILMVKTMLSG